jgi:hypothetical protein
MGWLEDKSQRDREEANRRLLVQQAEALEAARRLAAQQAAALEAERQRRARETADLEAERQRRARETADLEAERRRRAREAEAQQRARDEETRQRRVEEAKQQRVNEESRQLRQHLADHRLRDIVEEKMRQQIENNKVCRTCLTPFQGSGVCPTCMLLDRLKDLHWNTASQTLLKTDARYFSTSETFRLSEPQGIANELARLGLPPQYGSSAYVPFQLTKMLEERVNEITGRRPDLRETTVLLQSTLLTFAMSAGDGRFHSTWQDKWYSALDHGHQITVEHLRRWMESAMWSVRAPYLDESGLLKLRSDLAHILRSEFYKHLKLFPDTVLIRGQLVCFNCMAQVQVPGLCTTCRALDHFWDQKRILLDQFGREVDEGLLGESIKRIQSIDDPVERAHHIDALRETLGEEPGLRIGLTERAIQRLAAAEATGRWTDISGADRSALGTHYGYIVEQITREIAGGGRARVLHYPLVDTKLIEALAEEGGRVLITQGRLRGGAMRFDIVEIDFDRLHISLIDLTPRSDASHIKSTLAYASELHNLTGFPVHAAELYFVDMEGGLRQELEEVDLGIVG